LRGLPRARPACSEEASSREDILEYFRANMGEVPAWIRMMDEALPRGIERYYGLRNRILCDGALPRRIKELTLVAVNAAGLYDEGLRIHAIGVMNTGGSRKELLEGLLLAFIGGGIVAWLEGIRVLEEAGLL
jgi:alkylhydroperoxidase/carboxymuconolactone decarboxylase family protein YurZ